MKSNNATAQYNDSDEQQQQQQKQHRPLIRGVNLGGWLVLERYITPYMFAITQCHVNDDDDDELCWHRDQDAYKDTDKVCSIAECPPIASSYPIDEYTLGQAFWKNGTQHTKKGLQWLQRHLDTFITESHIRALKHAGVTHVRVPLPHWIVREGRRCRTNNRDEYFMGGDARWNAFVQLLEWCETHEIQVWPDLHTAPGGSQNGFDNSGQQQLYSTCHFWDGTFENDDIDDNDDTADTQTHRHPKHVQKTLHVIQGIFDRLASSSNTNSSSVITGFGLLNEPFKDCNETVYRNFLHDGVQIIIKASNSNTVQTVFASDMFQAYTFGREDTTEWDWRVQQTDSDGMELLLDSHYYQVFEGVTRELSPRQHIAYTCENHFRDLNSCCSSTYNDDDEAFSTETTTTTTQYVHRMVGEFSAAVDTLVVERLHDIMESIRSTGSAAAFHREFTAEERIFRSNFVQAQMVTYENIRLDVELPQDDDDDTTTNSTTSTIRRNATDFNRTLASTPYTSTVANDIQSRGWFFWTTRMEGRMFPEWDFLRGVSEGYIPPLVVASPSITVYGTCSDIVYRTNDSMSLLDIYPNPLHRPEGTWMGAPIDDDVVLQHGNTIEDYNARFRYPQQTATTNNNDYNNTRSVLSSIENWVCGAFLSVLVLVLYKPILRYVQRRKRRYNPIGNVVVESAV